MAYTPTNWQNLPDTTTPITANALNNMESGIKQNDTVIGGDEYDSTSTYEIGDFCIYNNKLYRCTTAISTAEAFTPAHWEETNVTEELQGNGKIIDDMDTAESQTVNAPSIHAVKDYVENYSSTEQVIGTWFGKPLYRNVIRFSSTFVVGNNTFNHGISNLGQVIKKELLMVPTSSGLQYFVPYIGTNGKALNINQINSTQVIIMAQEAWSSPYSWDLILEYTKTTD